MRYIYLRDIFEGSIRGGKIAKVQKCWSRFIRRLIREIKFALEWGHLVILEYVSRMNISTSCVLNFDFITQVIEEFSEEEED